MLLAFSAALLLLSTLAHRRWLGTCLDFQPTSVKSSQGSLIGCPWSQPNSTALMRPERPKQSDCLLLCYAPWLFSAVEHSA